MLQTSGTCWKENWIESVGGNIWVGWRQHLIIDSCLQPQCESEQGLISMKTSELSLRLGNLTQGSPGRIEQWILGLTTNYWRDESWIPIPFVVSIDVVHFHATKPELLKMLIPLRLEAKRAKTSDPTSALRFFPGDFCMFWIPDVLPSICCRKMVSDCWFVSDISSKNFGHYFLHFWESVFLGAKLQVRTDAFSLETLLQEGSNLYDLRDVWATQSQGWMNFFQLINRPIEVHFILKSKSCPRLYRAEDLRMISGANIRKVKCANMILLRHEGFLKKTRWNTWEKDG